MKKADQLTQLCYIDLALIICKNEKYYIYWLISHKLWSLTTAIPRMLAPQFAQNFLQLFFENHTQIQCFDVKITINK